MEWINNFWDIMLTPVNSMAMGFIGAISAAAALILNHYSWRRASILTILAFIFMSGWLFMGMLIMKNKIYDPEAIRLMVMTFILIAFIIAGYWMAGIINYFHPNPVRRAKRLFIAALRKLAQIIPSYKLSRPLEKKADKMEIIVEEQKKQENLSEEQILERMKQVIAMLL